jgi:hypothetical protein
MLQQAVDLLRDKMHAEAEPVLLSILQRWPGQPDALHFLGVLEHTRGHSEAALALIRQAIADMPGRAGGTYRVNPLYVTTREGDRLRLRLQFPSADYEDEYGACRQYLPEEATVDLDALARLEAGGPVAELADLIRRRIIVDLPRRYC